MSLVCFSRSTLAPLPPFFLSRGWPIWTYPQSSLASASSLFWPVGDPSGSREGTTRGGWGCYSPSSLLGCLCSFSKAHCSSEATSATHSLLWVLISALSRCLFGAGWCDRIYYIFIYIWSVVWKRSWRLSSITRSQWFNQVCLHNKALIKTQNASVWRMSRLVNQNIPMCHWAGPQTP